MSLQFRVIVARERLEIPSQTLLGARAKRGQNSRCLIFLAVRYAIDIFPNAISVLYLSHDIDKLASIMAALTDLFVVWANNLLLGLLMRGRRAQ